MSETCWETWLNKSFDNVCFKRHSWVKSINSMTMCNKGKGKTCKNRQNKQQYFEYDQMFSGKYMGKSEAILWPCVIRERAKLANINPRCTKGRASIKETTFPIRFQGDAWCFWNFLYLIAHTHTSKQKCAIIC